MNNLILKGQRDSLTLTFKNNYFSWIENLGVEPLFLPLAFLFVPAVFAFLALFVSVAFVLETIDSLQSKLTFRNYLLVPVVLLVVKGAYGVELTDRDILIGKGEHQEISTGKLKKFTISNKEVLSYKYDEKGGKLLIKGKGIGYSELLLFKDEKELIRIKVFVITKQKQLSRVELLLNLSGLGLTSNQQGDLLTINGKIDAKENLILFQKLIKNEKRTLRSKVELFPETRNQLIAEIYQLLFENYVDDFLCSENAAIIKCQHKSENPVSKTLIEYIENEYGVTLVNLGSGTLIKNYRLKLKLIQIENLDGKEIDLGLDQLSGTLGELFTVGPAALIKRNDFNLKNKNVHISTLAEPETALILNEESVISIGADIPYQASTRDQVNTEWKFAGLKVKAVIVKVKNRYKINYETEFTRPSGDGSISGNKEKSVIYVTEDKPIEMFKINFKTVGKSTDSLPILSAIPLLGEIFKSKNDQENYKNITGVVLLEQYES